MISHGTSMVSIKDFLNKGTAYLRAYDSIAGSKKQIDVLDITGFCMIDTDKTIIITNSYNGEIGMTMTPYSIDQIYAILTEGKIK